MTVMPIRDVIPASGSMNRTDFEDTLGNMEDVLFAIKTREKLTAARTYYVDGTNGADTNDGLTSGTAFATIQKAVDVALAIDFSIYNVTIQVADGTYAEQVNVTGKQVGTGTLKIQGNSTNAKAVKVGSGAANSFNCSGASNVTIKYMQFDAATGILVQAFSVVTLVDVACNNSSRLIYANDYGIVKCVNTSVEVLSSGTNLAVCYGRSYVSFYNTNFTLPSGMAWGAAGAFYVTGNSFVWLQIATFTGTATGKRYAALKGSIIDTNGGGSSFIPGDIAGTVDSSSYYL